MAKSFYLFVYGTLKKAHYNHELLLDAKYIAEVTSKHPYPMIQVDEPYPYLLDCEGVGYCIKGELYKIDASILAMLDILEGYPEHYTRREIEVKTIGIGMRAIAYFKSEVIEYEGLELLEEFV